MSFLFSSKFVKPALSPKRAVLFGVYAVVLAFSGLISSCSQYSTAPVSRAFHNLTARYNAYLQAKEQLGEAEKAIFKNNKDNYALPLPILIPLDSVAARAARTQLDAALKKASLVPERHQNSKWMDDSYYLIGMVRLYRADFSNAIETFKYINTNSEDTHIRQEALVGLMRAYTEQGDYTSALRVADLLRTLPLTKAQTRAYYLTKALLHQYRGEGVLAAALVEEALPLMPRGDRKARTEYALGQLYDLLGKTDLAVRHYAAVQKNQPPYDLGFYADLNRLLSSDAQGRDVNFTRMLSDRKNADLKDQIYLAMATKALGQKDYPRAVTNLRLAANHAKTKNTELGTVYLKLAEIYYEPLRNYPASSAYYDSTVTTLPKTSTRYASIVERQKLLHEFVNYTTTIRTEDSLQRLAAMNPAALDKYLDGLIADKQRREADEKARTERLAAQQAQQAQLDAATAALTGGNAAPGLWYFYNASAVGRGAQEFKQKWGNRPLEDNWRRSTKENTFANSLPSSTGTSPIPQSSGSLTPVGGSNVGPNKAEKDALLAQIPFSPQALASSQQRQEEAYFQVGKIYQLGLREPQNAIQAYNQLLEKFPQTKFEPETLYLLALLYEDQPQRAGYTQKLTQKYPDSYFARLLSRGNSGPLSASEQSAAQQLYSEAYANYGKGLYSEAFTQTERGLRDYAGNALEDKYALLRAMLIGKLQGVSPYQQALNQFIQNYPGSPLISMAREMLAVKQ